MELYLDGVESKFLEYPIELDLIWSDRNAVGLECSNDFSSAYATVEVTFFIGVGLDVDRLLTNLIGQSTEGNQAILLNGNELLFVLLDHPLVMVIRDDRETFWQKVVVGMAWFDLDDLSSFAQMLNVLNEHQLDTAIGAFGKAWELRSSFLASGL